MSYDNLLSMAADDGDTCLMHMAISGGATAYDSALVRAASGGHVTIVREMLRLGATDYGGAIAPQLRMGILT